MTAPFEVIHIKTYTETMSDYMTASSSSIPLSSSGSGQSSRNTHINTHTDANFHAHTRTRTARSLAEYQTKVVEIEGYIISASVTGIGSILAAVLAFATHDPAREKMLVIGSVGGALLSVGTVLGRGWEMYRVKAIRRKELDLEAKAA